jgi:heat shock protein HslJ
MNSLPSLSNRWIPLVIGLLMLLVTGCQSYDFGAAGSFGLAGTSWLVEEIDGLVVHEKVRSTLEFKGERVDGSAGCNRYSAPVVTRRSELRAGKAVTTRIVCSPAAMGQELRFLVALAETAEYRAEGDVLRLMDDEGVTRMRLVRMLESPRTLLCGDGVNFVTLLLHPAGTDSVEVELADTTRLLARAPADTGERFSNGDISIWTVGREATLEVSGHRFTCSEKGGP